MLRTILNKRVLSWALYDWANSAFTLIVITGFFPIFFRQYWAAELESSSITFYLGLTNAAASLIIAILAPFIGTVADKGGLKKQFLAFFAFLGILMSLSLYWVTAGHWQLALMIYLVGTLGFMGANVFYDALLVDVAAEKEMDRVSAWGYALGYFGSAILFAFCVFMTLAPERFGLESNISAVRLSFLLVALWWAVFSLPILLWVKENREIKDKSHLLRSSWKQLIETIRHIRQHRPVVIFLLAYWLYIDGVDSIVRMAVDYGQSLGFDTSSLIKALLLTQFIAFPAAVAFGYLGTALGTRKALLIGISVYVFATFWAASIDQTWEFYTLAAIIGLVQGGVQALSRSYYARLIPSDQATEFFGFYNMLGKSAAVIGPLMIGSVTVLTGSNRIGLLTLLILFIAGAMLLLRVDLED